MAQSLEQHSARKSMRLLVVEDYPDTARILCRFLGELGAVDSAANVDEALIKARETQYDLLLVDIQLKEKRTGVDLLHILRQDPLYARVPFVACTAYAMPDDRIRLLKEGFNGYVGKPFTKDQILKEVKRHWRS